MKTEIQQPFTNLQLELLKLFSMQVSSKDLEAIKLQIAQYFANKAINSADKVWETNNWTEKDETVFLNNHLRTPYNKH